MELDYIPPEPDYLDIQPSWRSVSKASVRDAKLAAVAKRAGANYSLRILWEARRAGIPPSLLFAMVEKESNFSNVFGHDPTVWVGAGTVTETKYRLYKALRGTPGKRMQGIGPTQLTWWEFQDRADRLGGAWKPQHNIRVGAEVLGSYYKKYKKQGKSTKEAIILAGRDYNGRLEYGHDLYKRYNKWHNRLN